MVPPWVHLQSLSGGVGGGGLIPFTARAPLGPFAITFRGGVGFRSSIFLYNTECIRLKEESHIHLGWLEGE